MKKYSVMITICIMTILVYFMAVQADELTVDKWREAFIKNSKYACRFVPSGNGFDVMIKKTENEDMWFIQIIGDNFIKTTKGQSYVMKYDAFSDKEFLLKLSIQASYDYNIHLFHDQNFNIPGDSQWHTYDQEFTGDPSVKGLIMYKVGLAPKDTVFKVRNIRIEPIGNITK